MGAESCGVIESLVDFADDGDERHARTYRHECLFALLDGEQACGLRRLALWHGAWVLADLYYVKPASPAGGGK